MAIINNAHAGSQINLLCLIYRVLHRNPKKFDKKELFEVCRPSTLFRKPGHEKRFRENLTFWQKEAVKLWDTDEEQKYYLVDDASDSKVSSIAKLIGIKLFKEIDEDFLKPENIEKAQLYRTLAFILSLSSFAPFGEESLTSQTLDEKLKALFTEFQLNDSEKSYFLEYCHFLGFLDLADSKGKSIEYVVDPTMVVKSALNDVFLENDQLSIKEFINQLSVVLPVLDGGEYKKGVENYLEQNSGMNFDSKNISEALSHSIERLNRMSLIRCKALSDDVDALNLTLPSGNASVSIIEFNRGEANAG